MTFESNARPVSHVDKWYRNYWERFQERKKLLQTLRPPCLFWYWSDTFNEVEQLYYGKTSTATRILDFGAGEGALKKKFLEAGFTGQYETFDISPESDQTYSSLSDITGPFDAIFCHEVIEHMTLNDYVDLMEAFDRLVRPGGIVAISTSNPACVIPMWSQDAGHIQQYPLPDLAADFVIRGYEIDPYRVRLSEKPKGVRPRVRFLLQRILCYLLGADYANGIVVIGTRKSPLE